MNGEYQFPKFISAEVKDLLKNIFITKPEDRFGIEQIRNHEWYKMVSPEAPSFNTNWTESTLNTKIISQLE